MALLSDDGKLSSFDDKPLASIRIGASTIMSFGNMTLGKPLKSMEIKTLISDISEYDEFIEDEDHLNLIYDRVFHFWTMSPDTSSRVFGPYYVPYIDETVVTSGKSQYKIRPLREVINPRFVRLSDSLYVMFFYSNFSTNKLPDDKYTDDPSYLIRTVEFATNYPELIREQGSSTTSPPSQPSSSIIPGKDNTLNYYPDENGEYIGNPRCALCSCIIRITPLEIGQIYDPPDPSPSQGSSSVSSSKTYRLYAIAERPKIVDWVGYRFAHDAHPSLLVNQVQNIEWMQDQTDAANYLNPSTIVPGKVIPPHHLINGMEAKMYPGFAGYDFDTIPINNVFKDSLNYILEIERIGNDPHSPEYCTYYNNFRPDAVEHRITKVEWKTVRAKQLTLTNRGWEYEDDYDSSLVVEYEYPYDDSKTDTWFVVLSIQYEAIMPPSYDVLKYTLCACDSSSSSSSSAAILSSSSSSSSVPCGETWLFTYMVIPEVINGDCEGDYLYLDSSFNGPMVVDSCEDWGIFTRDTWLADCFAWELYYCTESCSSPGEPSVSIITDPVPCFYNESRTQEAWIEFLGAYDCSSDSKFQDGIMWTTDPYSLPIYDWEYRGEYGGVCDYAKAINYTTISQGMSLPCFDDLSDCPCAPQPSSSSGGPGPSPSSSSSGGPGPSPSSSSSGTPLPPPRPPIPIEELFFADLSSDGYLSPYMGRPFNVVDASPSFKFGFFNKMIYKSLSALNFGQGDSSINQYNEDLSSVPNMIYDRVLHYYMIDGASGRYLEGPSYVAYVDNVVKSGDKSLFTLKPLREVINPRLQKLDDGVYVMYFFTNFTEEVEEYTDDPNKMVRMTEFATNFPSNLFASGSQPSSNIRRAPEDNTLNYYATGEPTEISTPKCALCSCIVRISYFYIEEESQGSSSSSGLNLKLIKYPICEKPQIVNWVGDRFASDFVQPLLINTTQRIDWSNNKQETDTLNSSATASNPPRQMEYYDIVNSLEAKMYPGYTGLNVGTRPIVDIYEDSLYHVFVLEVGGEDKYYLEVNPDVIFSTPTNILSYEWEHSAEPNQLNEPGLNVVDDPDENTPSAKTNTHYVVMRLRTGSSTSAAIDYCDKS